MTRTLPWILVVLGASACGPDRTPSPSPSSGRVNLTQATSGTTTLHTLFGAFIDVPVAQLRRGEFPTCEVELESGPCRVIRCANDPLTGADAGTITVSVDGVQALSSVRGDAVYSASGPGIVFEGGDEVTFTAGGATVPAFNASLVAPERFNFALPTSITPSSPVTLTWSGTVAAEEVELSLSQSERVVSCVVSAAAGSVTIGTDLLSHLEPGTLAFYANTTNGTYVQAGDYDVFVAASQGTHVTATVAE